MNKDKYIKINKRKLIAIFTLIILVCAAIGYYVLSFATNSDKTMFMNALKEDNTSLCLKIHKFAKVSGEEYNFLVDESKNYSLQAMGRTEKFPLRDMCLKAVQVSIELKSFGIDHN